MLTGFLFVKSLPSLASKLCYSFHLSTEQRKLINVQSNQVRFADQFSKLKCFRYSEKIVKCATSSSENIVVGLNYLIIFGSSS